MKCNPLKAPDERCGKHHTLRTRFFKGFKKGTADECWPWLKGTHAGYGIMRHRGGQVLVTRVAYLFAWGPIPKGEVVKQTCNNRLCVNPEHLCLMTVAEVNKFRRKGENIVKGENHPHAVVTDGDVIAMRQAHEGGESITSLAKRYGLHRASVWLIVTRRTWRHI